MNKADQIIREINKAANKLDRAAREACDAAAELDSIVSVYTNHEAGIRSAKTARELATVLRGQTINAHHDLIELKHGELKSGE
jgi:hypothetical protein